MNISACVITKDEEKNIDRCLESIKNIVDEIIIVDTGSNDNTVNVAKRYSNKIFHYVWEDDFSKARNFAIEKANGDYILFLDADEYLDCYFDLKESLKNEELFKDAYLIKIKNIDKDEKNKLIDEFLAIRLFKNDINIRYQGTIHEQLINLNGNNLSISYIDKLNIYHTGYSSSLMKEKAERNLERLEQEYAKNANNDRLYSYLCETHYYLGNKNKAEEYARLDIALGRRNVSYASRSYRILIEILKENDSRILELKDILEKSIKSFPKLPEFMAEFALYYASVFDYDMAIKNMNTAISLAEKYNDIEPTIFKNDKIQIAKKLILDWLKIKNDKIKISACVIVKNEEKNIGKWLESSSVYADELIVVDTGSDDKTIDIVKNTDAKLFYYRWNNNFADAKNFAISKASGDWIVFLDADEYFTDESSSVLRNIIKREHKNIDSVDALLCTIINVDTDNNNKEIHRFLNLRVFRNIKELKYYDKIHEGIGHSKRELRLKIEKDNLQIIHTGYSKNIIEDKLKRNLKLLLEDIEKNGLQTKHYRYLSDCYQGLGDLEKSIKYAKLYTESGIVSFGTDSDVYRNLIVSMNLSNYSTYEIRKYIEKAIELFPELPDFYAYYAENLFKENKFSAAKPFLEKAIFWGEKNISNNSSVYKNIESEVYSYLADVYIKENDFATSKKYITISLAKNKFNKRSVEQLFFIISKMNLDCAKEIGIVYNEKNEIKFILELILFENKYNCYFKDILNLYKNKFKIIEEIFLIKDIIISEKYKDAYSFALNFIVNKNKKLIICSLISETNDIENLKNYFQYQIFNVIKAIIKKEHIHGDYFETFKTILAEIISCDDDCLLDKYLSLLDSFSLEQKIEIALKLNENNKWKYSYEILKDIVATKMDYIEEGKEIVLYFFAKSLFYLSYKEEASEFFLLAKKSGFISNELDSYLKWLGEGDNI